MVVFQPAKLFGLKSDDSTMVLPHIHISGRNRKNQEIMEYSTVQFDHSVTTYNSLYFWFENRIAPTGFRKYLEKQGDQANTFEKN